MPMLRTKEAIPILVLSALIAWTLTLFEPAKSVALNWSELSIGFYATRLEPQSPD